MREVAYKGNLGVHEMFMFYDKANSKQIDQLDKLLKSGQNDLAMKLIEKVVGYKLRKESRMKEKQLRQIIREMVLAELVDQPDEIYLMATINRHTLRGQVVSSKFEVEISRRVDRIATKNGGWTTTSNGEIEIYDLDDPSKVGPMVKKIKGIESVIMNSFDGRFAKKLKKF